MGSLSGKIFLAITLAPFYSNSSNANTCGIEQPIRIDEGNGRLARASVQDQDGLGTCYANAASLILQSSQPDLPDLSFLQMSINHLESMNTQRTDGKKSYNIDGGYVCRAVNATVENQKKGIGLCPRSKVPAENLRNLDSSVWGPMDLLKRKDAMAAKGQESQNRNQGLDYFAALAENLKKEVERGADDRCRPPKYKIDYTKLQVVGVIEEIVMNGLEQNQGCIIHEIPGYDSDYCIGLQKLNGFSSYAKSKRYRSFQSLSLKWEYRDKILNRLREQAPKFRSAQDILKFVEAELHNIAFGASGKKQKSMLSNSTAPLRERFLERLESDLNLLKGQADEACRIQYAIELMTKNPKLLTKATCQTCNYEDIEHNVSRLGNVINDLQVKNLSQIYDFIRTNTNQSLDSQVMGILAANCGPKDWVKVPEQTRCVEESPTFTPEEFTNSKGAYQSFAEKNRNRMLNSLKNGKAVGYSLCTRFFKDSSFTYNAVTPRESATEKCQEDRHGFHAVALVGMRCKDGKAQYLVQNSWGTKWQPDRTDMKAENGKIWIDERDFFGNGVDFSYIDEP